MEALPYLLINQDLLLKAQAVFDTLDISSGTREDYKKSVKEFIAFINDKTVNNNTFLEFKQFLKKRNDIGVSAKNKYLISARILLKEMNRIGMMDVDITQNIKGFNQGHKHKKDGLSDEDINVLCQSMRNMPNNLESIRFKAIVALLIYQGLRQKEVIGLDVLHVDLHNSLIQITGKGRDDYENVHLHPDAATALYQWINIADVADGPLFFGCSNRALNQRITTRSLRRIITKELGSLGINKSTHGFRHYFTTKLIGTFKGDLLKVAEFTRHKTLDMLQVYNDAITTKESLPKYYSAFDGAKMF